MRKSRFTEEQITYALRQGDAGTPVSDVCRQMCRNSGTTSPGTVATELFVPREGERTLITLPSVHMTALGSFS